MAENLLVSCNWFCNGRGILTFSGRFYTPTNCDKLSEDDLQNSQSLIGVPGRRESHRVHCIWASCREDRCGGNAAIIGGVTCQSHRAHHPHAHGPLPCSMPAQVRRTRASSVRACCWRRIGATSPPSCINPQRLSTGSSGCAVPVEDSG